MGQGELLSVALRDAGRKKAGFFLNICGIASSTDVEEVERTVTFPLLRAPTVFRTFKLSPEK